MWEFQSGELCWPLHKPVIKLKSQFTGIHMQRHGPTSVIEVLWRHCCYNCRLQLWHNDKLVYEVNPPFLLVTSGLVLSQRTGDMKVSVNNYKFVNYKKLHMRSSDTKPSKEGRTPDEKRSVAPCRV